MGNKIMKQLESSKSLKHKNEGYLKNKIDTTLKERYFGKHTFKAAKLMRDSILIGGMLTNAESWIKLTNKDLEDLEKPDMMLTRKVLRTKANPSK